MNCISTVSMFPWYTGVLHQDYMYSFFICFKKCFIITGGWAGVTLYRRRSGCQACAWSVFTCWASLPGNAVYSCLVISPITRAQCTALFQGNLGTQGTFQWKHQGNTRKRQLPEQDVSRGHLWRRQWGQNCWPGPPLVSGRAGRGTATSRGVTLTFPLPTPELERSPGLLLAMSLHAWPGTLYSVCRCHSMTPTTILLRDWWYHSHFIDEETTAIHPMHCFTTCAWE